MKRFTKITCALVASLFLGVNLTSGYCFAEETSAIHQKVHDELINDSETSQKSSDYDSPDEDKIISHKNVSSKSGDVDLNCLKRAGTAVLGFRLVSGACYLLCSLLFDVTNTTGSQDSTERHFRQEYVFTGTTFHDFSNTYNQRMHEDVDGDRFFQERFYQPGQQNLHQPQQTGVASLRSKWESWKQSFDNASQATNWGETYQHILDINTHITNENINSIVGDSVIDINNMIGKCQTYKQSFPGNNSQFEDIRGVLGQIRQRKKHARQ